MKALAVLEPGKIIYIEDLRGINRTYEVKEHMSGGFVLCAATNKRDRPLCDLDERVSVIAPKNSGVHIILSWITESRDDGAEIVVDPVGKMWFVERRRYFRLKGPDVKARYAIVDEKGELVSGLANGLVWDLSGNGIALFIQSDNVLEPHCMLKLEIILPDETNINITGEIIRCAHKVRKKKEYLLGIHFAQIDDADRERIVQYVISEQLAHLRKEKLIR